MNTEVLLKKREGLVGIRISLAKKNLAREPTIVADVTTAQTALEDLGHKVVECVENKGSIITNTITDNLPFEEVWWFKLVKVRQRKQRTKKRESVDTKQRED